MLARELVKLKQKEEKTEEKKEEVKALSAAAKTS